MGGFVGPRLWVMMFLQFFVWGAWYVTVPRFVGTIGFTGTDIAWIYSVGPIAGIISPFFVGMVADRFFATERVLGVMHLLAAAAMFGAATLMTGKTPPIFIIGVFFLHMLCYFPTLSLTNTLSMHNIESAERQFPAIRVFGTIGWIAAGFVVGQMVWGDSINMFHLASGAGVLLGLYSFTLPHTPPPLAGQKVSVRELLGMDAFVLLKRRSFLTFMASSFLVCIPLAFYYQMGERAVAQAGISEPPTKMAFGQVTEIVFMLAMPWFFRRLGVKWMLLVGMAAWVARYALFAIGAPQGIVWMMIGGILLHGICYDFFFVTGQIYTDKAASPEIRGQAQGMLVLFTLGLGMLIGAQVGGKVEDHFTPPESKALKEEVKQLGERITEAEARAETAIGSEKQELASQVEQLKAEKDEKALRQLKLMDWRSIWMVPMFGAGVLMLLFAAVFKDDAAGATDSVGDGPDEQEVGEQF